jgi:DNA-binding FadR family transcriptional regulator
MMTDPPQLRRGKLSDQVRQQLLEHIQSQAVRPGDALPSERELMERLGVGRPAIREAMQDLQRTGLIEIRHGERARVAEPSMGRMVEQVSETMKHFLSSSPASLENLKEARTTFEREMARTAARMHSAEDLRRLENTLAAQSEAVTLSNRFREIDGRFHREIAAIGGNPIWTALSDALFRWLTDFHIDLVAVPGLEKLTLDEHHGILTAIASGDPDRAGRAMSDHLSRANDLYRLVNRR